jgi:hypothetical protein
VESNSDFTTPRMSILGSNGNVGIGTTTPTETLHVNGGNALVTGNITANGNANVGGTLNVTSTITAGGYNYTGTTSGHYTVSRLTATYTTTDTSAYVLVTLPHGLADITKIMSITGTLQAQNVDTISGVINLCRPILYDVPSTDAVGTAYFDGPATSFFAVDATDIRVRVWNTHDDNFSAIVYTLKVFLTHD